MGSWLRLLIVLSLLEVCDQNASRLFRDDYQRAGVCGGRVQRGRVLDQGRRQILVQGDVDFLGHNWVDPMGPKSDGRATFWDKKSLKALRNENQHPS